MVQATPSHPCNHSLQKRGRVTLTHRSPMLEESSGGASHQRCKQEECMHGMLTGKRIHKL
eukprot:1143659-Pelagomonas_calceolata.AAC.3